MNARKYVGISLVGITLFIGGLCIGANYRPAAVVHAQQRSRGIQVASLVPQTRIEGSVRIGGQVSIGGPQYEDVVPQFSSESGAFGVLLCTRMASDQATVRGIDLVKLHENTLNLLVRKNLVSTAEAAEVMNSARPERVLRMKAIPPDTKEGK